eukprot:m51a1_g14478 hypothetical protein (507) ;mRNA; f:699633-701153
MSVKTTRVSRAVVLVLLGAVLARADQCVANSDITGDIISRTSGTGASECSDLCRRTDECRGYSYSAQTCTLKRGTVGLFTAQGICSNVLQCTPNNDIPGHDLISSNVTGGDVECAQRCRSTDTCTGFAYWRGNCWLKTGDIQLVRETERHEGICSGAIQCTPNTDSPGNDIADFEAPRGSSECADRCRNTAACRGFAYVGTHCWLKSGQVAMVRAPSKCAGALQCNSLVYTEGPNVAVHDTPMGDTQCADRCRSTVGCAGFTYWAGRCFLKSGQFVSMPDDGTHPGICTGWLQCSPTINSDHHDLVQFQTPHGDNECADHCRSTVGCTGFTYWAGRCFLKSGDFPSFADDAKDPHPGICTGWLQCKPTINSDHHDLVQFQTPRGDNECADRCRSTVGCTGFTYWAGRCFLKSGDFPSFTDDSKDPHPGICTGRLQCKPTINSDHHDLVQFQTPHGDNECADRCRSTLNCTGFTYWAGRCFLKSGDFPSFADDAKDPHPGICTGRLQ